MPRISPVLYGTALVLGSVTVGQAQNAGGFHTSEVEVVSEWTGLDRGDGSGTYHLTTRVSDGRDGTTIEHRLDANRTVDHEVESSESLVVLESGAERARAGSDPEALGPWAETAVANVIPFDMEFNTDAWKSYRARDKEVVELVRSAVPEAKVTTRAGSDGRTTASVEIPDVHPVDELAASFVAIRQAFRDADVGLAKLQIKGRATVAPVAEVGTTQ